MYTDSQIVVGTVLVMRRLTQPAVPAVISEGAAGFRVMKYWVDEGRVGSRRFE